MSHLFEFEPACLEEVLNEYTFAVTKYPKFTSAHEGYAILLEEVDELWDEVKVKQSHPERKARMRAEAIQVAAMALRFLTDCC